MEITYSKRSCDLKKLTEVGAEKSNEKHAANQRKKQIGRAHV